MLDNSLVASLAVRDGLLELASLASVTDEKKNDSEGAVIDRDEYERLRAYVQDAVSEQFTYADTARPRDPAIRNRFRNIVMYAVGQLKIKIEEPDMPSLVQKLFDDILGYGPLEKYFFDPEVTEIKVNGLTIRYEKNGVEHIAPESFETIEQAYNLVQRMIAPTGRRLDLAQPEVNARLFDGSRLIAQIAPVAVDGILITIRRFRQDITIADLISKGAVSAEIVDFLQASVKARLNIVVSGSTSSGKTTWLNNLASFIPASESIITIEDPAELQLQHPDVRRLEARPKSIEGTGEIKMLDLVHSSLRMAPDRIIVGECRGAEAFAMLQAMNTGHLGSMTTIHANSAKDAVRRLRDLMKEDESKLETDIIYDQIASVIDLIVHVTQDKTGKRRLDHIAEVVGPIKASDGRTNDVELNTLFAWNGNGWIWKAQRCLREEILREKGGWRC